LCNVDLQNLLLAAAAYFPVAWLTQQVEDEIVKSPSLTVLRRMAIRFTGED
jgi:hypothetical protein